MMIGLRTSIWPPGSRRGPTPATIYGSNLKLWLRADLGITLNGGDVSAWANQGNAGGSFDQATAANQPAWTSSDANLNGKPSVTFTAANTDRLVSTLAASAWNFLHDGTGATLWVVTRLTNSANAALVATRTAAGASRGVIITHVPASNAVQMLVSDGVTNVINVTGTANAAEPLSTVVLFTHLTTATPDAEIFYNPSTSSRGSGSGTPSASNAAFTMYIGSTATPANPLEGSIAEVIGVDTVDAARAAQVQSYLLARYGFQ